VKNFWKILIAIIVLVLVFVFTVWTPLFHQDKVVNTTNHSMYVIVKIDDAEELTDNWLELSDGRYVYAQNGQPWQVASDEEVDITKVSLAGTTSSYTVYGMKDYEETDIIHNDETEIEYSKEFGKRVTTYKIVESNSLTFGKNATETDSADD
jgi:hypothetical protein